MGDHIDYERKRPSFFGIKPEREHYVGGEGGDGDDDDDDHDDLDDDDDDTDKIWDESQGWWPTRAVWVPADFGKPWDQAEHGLVRHVIPLLLYWSF
jgi:hypothetical protein